MRIEDDDRHMEKEVIHTVGGIKTVTFPFQSIPFKRKRERFLCSWKHWTAFNETRIEWKRNGVAMITRARY